MNKIPNPCEGCTQAVCDYRRCPPYQQWYVAAWNEFRRHARHGYWDTYIPTDHKFTYTHPDMTRRYLRNGPCGLCACADVCENPCQSYWRWWDLRMVWLKWIVQEGRRVDDCKNRTCIH